MFHYDETNYSKYSKLYKESINTKFELSEQNRTEVLFLTEAFNTNFHDTNYISMYMYDQIYAMMLFRAFISLRS